MGATDSTPAALDRDAAAIARALLGEGVALAFGPDEADEGLLLPEETGTLARAVPRRRREFAAGRVCARRALERLGRPAAPIPANADRSPRWPDGVTGSIAHAGGLCVAAVASVAPSAVFRALGIDVEPAGPLEASLLPWIATAAERPWCAAPDHARLLFSAKEAFYKAQYGVSRTLIGFHDVVLRFDLAAGAFEAVLQRPVTGFAEGARFVGRFARLGPWLVTAVRIPPVPPAQGHVVR